MIRTLCLVTSVYFFVGCTEEPETTAIPKDEAAELIASTLSSGSFGLNTVLDQVISFASGTEKTATPCGKLENIGYILENQPNQSPSFYYSFEYAWTDNCLQEQDVSSIDVGLSYTGEFDDPEIKAEYGGMGMLRFEEGPEGLVRFKGNFDRSHHYQLKKEEEQQGQCNVQISLEELLVDQEDRQIKSGLGKITMNGITNLGKYSLQGTIFFEGDNSATLEIGQQQYNLDLMTGRAKSN